VEPEDKTPAETQTEPHAKPLPDSEVRPLRKPQDERQDRSRREFEADLVIGFIIGTVVRRVAGTVRRNVESCVQNTVSKTVVDHVCRNLPVFHDKALVRTIDTGVGDNVAEFEDEFDPEFDDRFAADFVVRSVADRTDVIDLTQTDAELLSMPMETESLPALMKTRSEAASLYANGIKSPKLP
jgi:hypothetical protein